MARKKIFGITKKNIRDYTSEEDVERVVKLLKKKAFKGDSKFLQLYAEAIFGKTAQTKDDAPAGRLISDVLDELENGQETT